MTKEQLDFILNLCDGTRTSIVIADAYNKKYGANRTPGYIRNIAAKNGVSLGKGRKSKGLKTWCEGIHYQKKELTEIKGHSRMTKDGYKNVNHLLWELYHGEEVPKGMVVFFLDGNKKNRTKENLTLVNRKENISLALCGYKKLPDELKPSVLALVRLQSKIGIGRCTI